MTLHSHKSIRATLTALSIVLAFVSLFLPPTISHAQGDVVIKITEPAEGANISGPFVVAGTATVPFENTLQLKVTSTSANEQLISQPLPVTGEAGQQGTFRVVLNYTVAAATPALIQVINVSPKDGSALAKAEVRVVLRKYDATPGQSATGSADGGFAAAQLALLDYEGRVQTTTPIPQSIEDRTFSDQCLGLPRPNETCVQGEVAGKVVKLSFGGVAYTYNVGNNQARLDQSQSVPVTQKGAGLPKLLADASAVAGVTLYLPPKFDGAFAGIFFKRVDWEAGQSVTLTYGADNNPTDVKVVERHGTAAPTPAKPNGETVKMGAATVPVQVDGGRKYVEWAIQSTVINVSVPQNISTADLAALANGFTLPGGQAGQANLLDRTQFGKLTLNLPEPVRSVEMAREALLGLVKPPRLGSIISIQAKQFTDACLGLARQGEACTGGATPGYVVGVADTELYRYHVANGNGQVRLNRDNSELKIKGNVDFATVEAARASVTIPLAGPNDPNVTLLGIETGKVNSVSGALTGALLVYKDNNTGGVFTLTETTGGPLPGSTTQDQQVTVNGKQVAVKSDPNGRTASLIVQGADNKQSLVTLWASPEIGAADITRILNSLATS